MQAVFTELPPPFALQPGEEPCPASEAAGYLLEVAGEAAADAEAGLAQLGAAPDVTPEAVELGVRLRQLLSQAAAVAELIVLATAKA